MAKLDISMKLTMNDGSFHEINNTNDFGKDDIADEEALEQYWAMLKGVAGASEEDERKGRADRKTRRGKAKK